MSISRRELLGSLLSLPLAGVALSRAVSGEGLTHALVIPETKVDGYRLGRHVQVDERSRAYPAELAPGVRSVTHNRRVPIFDQGKLGSCTGEAVVGVASTSPFAHRGTQAEAVAVYSAATKIDDIPGTYPPIDTGSSVLAVCKVARKRGLIGTYEHAFTIDQLLRALVLTPGILGIKWLSGCDRPAEDGVVRWQGWLRGGHAFVAHGIDTDRELVWLTNSWGERFGVNGRFAMSFTDLEKALADDGEAVFPKLPR